MAKRVIQMYDKYKSTTKTYPKVIKECLQKDVTDYIEGQVEANPTLAGTEASLTGLQVGDTKYVISQGTTVVANPTLAGTEGDLQGLQVGDTKYKVGSPKLYQHDIQITASGSKLFLRLTIFNSSNSEMLFNNIMSFLSTNNFRIGQGRLYKASGSFYSDSTFRVINGVMYDNTNQQLIVKGASATDGTDGSISYYSTNVSISDTRITLL